MYASYRLDNSRSAYIVASYKVIDAHTYHTASFVDRLLEARQRKCLHCIASAKNKDQKLVDRFSKIGHFIDY